MPVTTTKLFHFLDGHQSCSIERHEIASAVFGALRRSLRKMIVAFCEGDDQVAGEISDRLRSILSEWLTVPVPFDDSMLEALREIGDAPTIESRWGRDIRAMYEDACRCAQKIRTMENPMRAKLADLIRGLRENGRSFRIYCHRRSRIYFESLSGFSAGEAPGGDVFLHSVVEYREAQPFDVLIKVGPLRSRGWGSAPDALLTAPRFDTLVQVVWSGCGDEPGFGYDPVSLPPPDTDAGADIARNPEQYSLGLPISWKVQSTRSSDDSVDVARDIPDEDEFRIFTRLAQPREMRNATLVQNDAETGILYPPHSRVASFDAGAHATGAIEYRLPGETLVEGMLLICPILDDMQLGGSHAEEGHYSRIWQEKLNSEFRRDPNGLVERLRANGLALLQLKAAIENWCRPPTTVIHAPQQRHHFQILIKVLGLDFDASTPARMRRAPWWEYAWDEIRRARGEAIQTGFHEHDIEDNQLLNILKELEPEIRAKAANRKMFEMAIPDGQDIRGLFRFYTVLAIEEGFVVPPGELKIVSELNRIDQWRV